MEQPREREERGRERGGGRQTCVGEKEESRERERGRWDDNENLVICADSYRSSLSASRSYGSECGMRE